MALGHNGNLTNTAELRTELASAACAFETTSDTEVIARADLRAPRARSPRPSRDAMAPHQRRLLAVV